MDCPICGFEVSGLRGLAAHFRHNPDTHPDYKEWKSDQEWAGKVEGQDYVTCLECGHRAKALQGHLQKHFMFPNAYMIDEFYEDEWKAMLERDRVKREQIEAAPDLTYMEIRYDEPCEDVSYLRGRLFQLGVL